jgi:hypothetical protein
MTNDRRHGDHGPVNRDATGVTKLPTMMAVPAGHGA